MGQTKSIKIDAHIFMEILKKFDEYNNCKNEHIVPNDILDMHAKEEKIKANR